MSAIMLAQVRKSFKKKNVLNGISGEVEHGKVVGVLGRNGEGKTTLFRIMLDMLAHDGGYISILGREPNGTGKVRGLVGYIPERPTFHEFMSVQDVLKLRAGFFPTWIWTKAYKMANELELDLSTPIKGASKGALAKTAWICATAHNPKVLLLDEPTSGLDSLVRDSVLTHLVGELAEEGKSIMVANHHMEELAGVLDEIWVMAGGKIRKVYSVEELRENACLISGRPKAKELIPEDLAIVEEPGIGDLVRWQAVDQKTVERVRELCLLDQMKVEPLPLETVFKLLLALYRDGSN